MVCILGLVSIPAARHYQGLILKPPPYRQNINFCPILRKLIRHTVGRVVKHDQANISVMNISPNTTNHLTTQPTMMSRSPDTCPNIFCQEQAFNGDDVRRPVRKIVGLGPSLASQFVAVVITA